MKQTSPATVLLFWDYDTQSGADRSRAPGGPKDWGNLEFENTERLLEILAQFEMPSCFAVVGATALPGERPYHDPDQIRAIHAAGHEIASHSFHHEWLPGLDRNKLRKTLEQSKDVLEQCIGAEVVSFVPPYNQPFDFPGGFSFSLSERREAKKDRTDLPKLCETLRYTGYRFCRVGYRPMHIRAAERLLGRQIDKPHELEKINGLDCIRTNAAGFEASTIRLLRHCTEVGGILVVYAHPHSLSSPQSSQRFESLETFLGIVDEFRGAGRLRCLTPRDLVMDRVPVTC